MTARGSAAIALCTVLLAAVGAVPSLAASWQALSSSPTACLEHPAAAIGNYTAPQYDA